MDEQSSLLTHIVTKSFVVHADEKPTAFLELESTIPRMRRIV